MEAGQWIIHRFAATEAAVFIGDGKRNNGTAQQVVSRRREHACSSACTTT